MVLGCGPEPALVLGATGRQAGAVAAALLSAGVPVRARPRDVVPRLRRRGGAGGWRFHACDRADGGNAAASALGLPYLVFSSVARGCLGPECGISRARRWWRQLAATGIPHRWSRRRSSTTTRPAACRRSLTARFTSPAARPSAAAAGPRRPVAIGGARAVVARAVSPAAN